MTEHPKYLLTTDLDGTLVFENEISAADRQALAAWRAAGHLAATNTGRSIAAARFCLDHSDTQWDYHILNSGAVITDANYQPLYAKSIPQELVAEVYELLKDEEEVGVFATTLDTRDLRLAFNFTGTAHPWIMDFFEPTTIEDLAQHSVVGMPIWVYRDDFAISALLNRILEVFQGRLACHRNGRYLDIAPIGCTKQSGTEWLLNHLVAEGHLNEEFAAALTVCAMGDNFNDLPMLEVADQAATFPHAPEAVQQAMRARPGGRVCATGGEFLTQLLVESAGE